MPGIVGYIDFENKVGKDLLSLMMSAITHHDNYVMETYEKSPLWIGRSDLPLFNPESQPCLKDDLVVFFEGNITNKDELAKSDILSQENNIEIFIRLFHKYGVNLVNKVKGHFTAFVWDTKKESLVIINDRFGRHPLYYARTKNQLFFGSELKAFLPCKFIEKEINDQAIVDFMKFHFLIGDETFFKNIFLLPYASILEYQRDALSVNQYWDITFSAHRSNRSTTEYVNELHILTEQALKRAVDATNRKIGVMLSGGLDSRNIAVHVPKGQNEVHTFTFGQKEFKDVKAARETADRLGFKHHFIPVMSRFLADLSETTISLLDGMTWIYTAEDVYALSHVVKEKIDLLLEGSSGNLVFGSYPPGSLVRRALFILPLINRSKIAELYRSIPKNELAVKVCGDLCETLAPEELPLEELLSKDYYGKVERLLGKSLNEVVTKGCKSHRTPCELLDYVYFTVVVRRWNITAQLSFRWQVETVDPFLDYDLVDFMCKIPSELRLRRLLVRKELEMHHPEIRHIPITGNLASDIIRTVIQRSHITRILPQIKHEDNIRSTYLREEKEFIERILLDEKTLTRGIFNPETIRKVVRDHMSNKRDYTDTIGTLVSIELWFRLFID